MSASVIKLEAAGKHYKDLAPKVKKAAQRGLLSAALRGVQTIQTVIIPSRSPQPVDRGVYRAGWRAEVIPLGAEIINTEAHAVVIEEGVRGENVKPGKAMFAALREWAIRKGIGSRTRLVPHHTALRKSGGKLVANHTVVRAVRDDSGVDQAVWAIIGSMKKRGIFNRGGAQGLGILRELVAKYLPEYAHEEVQREVSEALSE